MNKFQNRCLCMVALFAVAVTGGCSGTSRRLNVERDRLLAENRDLRAALENADGACGSVEAERDRLAAEVARLEQENQAPPPMSTETPFDQIQGIEIEQTVGMIKIKVPGDVLFPPGKTTLRAASKRTLDQIAQVIRVEYAANTIGVEGHTDTDPIRRSRWKDNLELSLQRAAAVSRYLQAQGIDGKDMYAAGWGSHHPRETKKASRRVEIVVLTG